MAYPALLIANKFLEKAISFDQELTPLKLLKLVYLAHGWHLGLFGTPLIREGVSAWKFGPVIEELYQEFRKFGNNPITQMAKLDDKAAALVIESDRQAQGVVDKVWEVYGPLTAIQLSNLTHEKGTPWYQAWVEEGGKNTFNHPISNAEIENYFKKQAA